MDSYRTKNSSKSDDYFIEANRTYYEYNLKKERRKKKSMVSSNMSSYPTRCLILCARQSKQKPHIRTTCIHSDQKLYIYEGVSKSGGKKYSYTILVITKILSMLITRYSLTFEKKKRVIFS